MSDESESVAGSGITRWTPAAVVFTALGGFVALAWYAYNVGTQSVSEDSILVVEADKTPMKEKPEDPGGMQFPNQDKVIFETIAGDNNEPPKVERILPAPEEPMAASGSGETTTWVNDKIAQAPVEVETKEADAEATVVTTESKVDVKQEFVREAAVDKKSEPAKAAAAEIASFKQEKKQAEVKEKPADVLDKAVKSTPKATGKAKAQLGAYGSEKEAKAAWSAVQKKFGDAVSGHDYVVVKADLGAKGIFYRLRVTGFADAADVKKFCAKLSAKGQACIAAGDK
ncbi:MAG: SPOR domain-containing protein [Alphaproteobacteria bacterium]